MNIYFKESIEQNYIKFINELNNVTKILYTERTIINITPIKKIKKNKKKIKN